MSKPAVGIEVDKGNTLSPTPLDGSNIQNIDELRDAGSAKLPKSAQGN